MKVFLLEDDENRIKTILCNFERFAEFTIAKDFYSAKKLFNKEEDYFLMLDHDLGGKIYVSSEEENTGAEFCRWLVKNVKKRYLTVIHSCNPGGSDNMKEILQKAYYDVSQMPFPILMDRWDKGILNFLGHYKYDS